MLVGGSLDLLRPLSSHDKPIEESDNETVLPPYVHNHLTKWKVELRGSTCVKTDRINVYPAEFAVSQQRETNFLPPDFGTKLLTGKPTIMESDSRWP